MTLQIIRTNQAPAPVGPYNQAIAAKGTLLFVAGQIPLNPETGEIVGGNDITQQTQQAGTGWENVVKTSVFLSDLNNFVPMNQVYASYFDEATAPARACVEVARLPKDVLVEIDCIAILPD